MDDSDIIERVKVMPLQPGDLVVFELGEGTSQSEAREFIRALETLARQRPEITFCAMHELKGVRIVRQAEIPGYLGNTKKALPTDVRRPEEEGGWDGLR